LTPTYRHLVALAALLASGCVPDFAKSPTATRAPQADAAGGSSVADGWFTAGDGTRLPLVAWLPCDADKHPTPIRAVLLAVHGFNDRKAAFRLSAELWQHDNIATYAYDQRGFGANPTPGRWPGSATLVADLASAIKAMRARYPGLPLYVVGESMGGAVVLDAFGGHENVTVPAPDGIILSAPAVWGRRTESVFERVALWAAIRLIPSVSFTGEGFGVLASDNIPMLRELGRDPLFIKDTRVDSIYGLVNLMDAALAAGATERLPTLLLYGRHDELVPPEAMQLLVDELPERASGRQRIVYYPEGWHMLLRDQDRAIVAGDVASWMFDRSGPLPSGHEFTGTKLPEHAKPAKADAS
jgi:alpha-beta hydrolase superfamily lysophospholipase